MRAVVDDVAADALARDVATLTVTDEETPGWPGLTLSLEPRNPNAAPVELGAGVEATYVVVGNGPHLLQAELWDPIPEDRGRELAACLEAVIEGRVEAAVEPHWSGARSVLTFHIEPEPWTTHGYRVGAEKGYWRESYEPY